MERICISSPFKGKVANEKLIPNKPNTSGKRPVTQRGQIPATSPPTVPSVATVPASLHALR